MKIQLDQQTERLTERIIGAELEVSNVLGHGFLEIVYRKALKHEIRTRGLLVAEEVPFEVCYKGIPVGTYFADIIVEASVIVELKAVDSLNIAHVGQVINYLKASNLHVRLLFNFGTPRLSFRRILL